MATIAVQSGLQLYLRSINESPLLTADEEKQLARRIIHHSDGAARERMVRSNLRLVVNIAKHYVNRGLSLPDLIEEVSEYLKMTRKKLNIIKKAVKAYNSPTQSGSADGEVTINELVADTHNPTPDDEVMGNDDLKHLEQLLDHIDSREAKILKLRY